MSNCIDVYNERVVFNSDEIDIPALRKLAEEHASHPHSHIVQLLCKQISEEEYNKRPKLDVGDTWCWFLRNNTVIEDDKVTIDFGHGESGHTVRDFKQTLWFLNQYITTPIKQHTFILTNEYDGHQSEYDCYICWPYPSLDALWDNVKAE